VILISEEFKNNQAEFEANYFELKEYESINSVSDESIDRVGNVILRYDLVEWSPYFNGFVYMVFLKSTMKSRHILLDADISHEMQIKALSCEANTVKDLVNFYYRKFGWSLISEQAVINKLPFDTSSLVKIDWWFGYDWYWGDPDKNFVGNINGRQSSMWYKFSGYGIHAKPLVPIVEEYLSAFDIDIVHGIFDEDLVIKSLSEWHPVLFWYVHSGKTVGQQWFFPFSWKTYEWKNVTVYIWEHVALLLGLDLDDEWKIKNLYYYDGLDPYFQISSYEDIKPFISMQNMAIYISSKDM